MASDHTEDRTSPEEGRLDISALASTVLSVLSDKGEEGAQTIRSSVVQKLVEVSLQTDSFNGEALLEELKDRRISADQIVDIYIPQAARELGRMWCEDIIGFAKVTIATARLQGILTMLAPPWATKPSEMANGANVLLLLQGNDSHTLGPHVATAQMRRAGASVRILFGARDDTIVTAISEESYDMVLFSGSRPDALASIAKLVKRIRTGVLAPPPLVLGGIVLNRRGRSQREDGCRSGDKRCEGCTEAVRKEQTQKQVFDALMNTSGSSFWSSGSVPLIDAEVLSSIIRVASDIALVVSRHGKILSVLINPNETSFGKLNHWEGRPLVDFLTRESRPKIEAVMNLMEKGETPSRSVELNHTDNAVWEFPVRYSFHPFGSDGSFLMLGRDLRPIAETQQQLVQAQMSLEQGYEARREFDARYRLLLRTVRDNIVFVSVSDGKIKDLNDPAAALLQSSRDDLIGTTFAQEFRDKRPEEFTEALINASISESNAGIEVQSRRGRQRVMITPQVFRAAGERILICRLTTADETTARFDNLSNNLASVFEKGSDAFVFTTATGTIEACNDAFLDLVDAAHVGDVRGRSFADFLGRGQIDMSVLLENARRTGQMRMYSTKLLNEFGAKTPVEMSVTFFEDRSEPTMGFVIRDISRVDVMRKAPLQTSEESSRNVMELVGSATLKEIVSETTDVVEKMCIETAVSLTRNNRVAAAEMLGLSRQSLYVKLRKYGLLSKDGDGD